MGQLECDEKWLEWCEGLEGKAIPLPLHSFPIFKFDNYLLKKFGDMFAVGSYTHAQM